MNIFAVEKCPHKAAQALPDKLVVKMPLESAQMLCTAHRVLSGDEYCDERGMYKTAHINHPCSIWTRTSDANYYWLFEHFAALCEEYTKRYNKVHLSQTKLFDALLELPLNIKHGKLTKFALAMPDQYKEPDDHILSYRQYMIAEKEYALWAKGTPKPRWWKD